jgi:hypothetical protein
VTPNEVTAALIVYSGPLDNTMVGRMVRAPYHRQEGTVVRWEPLGSGMCDVLIEMKNGKRVWYASPDLRPIDGDRPLPSRRVVQKAARERDLSELRALQAQLIRDVNQPWPGCEFGKVHLDQALDAAIRELEGNK